LGSIELDIDGFMKLNNILLSCNMEERAKIPGLNPMRVDTIALASLFTSVLIRECCFNKFYQTDYALKEGVLVSKFGL
jgi:exopolyphosphatase/guanosine-5'-triphosphate,3'-diphosphate pyrophosphatase